MKRQAADFNTIVENLYGLPLEDRMEIMNLLEHNIADARRDEMADNYKKSLLENKKGELTFSSDIKQLKKML